MDTIFEFHNEGDYLRQNNADFYLNVPAQAVQDSDYHEMQTANEESEKLLFFARHGVETGHPPSIQPFL